MELQYQTNDWTLTAERISLHTTEIYIYNCEEKTPKKCIARHILRKHEILFNIKL